MTWVRMAWVWVGLTVWVGTGMAQPVRRWPIAPATRAEREAEGYAARELAAAPPRGNLPDLSLPEGTLETAQHLERLDTVLELGGGVWGLLQLPLLLWVGWAAGMGRWSVRAGRRVRWAWLRFCVEAGCFALLLEATLEVLDLPLAVYGHRLGLRYGLSVEGWGAWWGDRGKGFLIGVMGTAVMLGLLMAVIRRAPRRWWVVFWAACAPILLFVLWIEPTVIEPRFNHFEPLARSSPELAGRLEAVARKAGIDVPVDRMFLMKASEKTPTLNAYVTGFGSSKRLVIWDTTVRGLTPDQLLLVFGHEAGHYVLHHVMVGAAAGWMGLLPVLYLGYRGMGWLLGRFGGRWRMGGAGEWAAVVVLLFVADCLSTVAAPVGSWVSRQAEHTADVFGQEAVHGLVADPQEAARGSFERLAVTSLEVPHGSRWMELLGSHPALGRRAAFAKAYDPWRAGYGPKYFGR